MTLAEVGTLEGSVAKSTTVVGDETLSAPVKLSMGVTSVEVLGLQIPTSCTTEQPLSLGLSDTLTGDELLTKGWSFTGTTTLTRFKCEGAFGRVVGPVLTLLLSVPRIPMP